MDSNYTKTYTIKSSRNNFINYSYLIQSLSRNSVVAIDPAWDLKSFINILRKENLQLEAILLTHSHIDHINLVENLTELYNCKVLITKREALYYNFNCRNIQYLTEEEPIYIGGMNIDVLFSSGHTKGGCSYIIDNNAFTGDTLFIEGCGICDTDGGSVYEMYYTLQKMKRVFKGGTKIFPGHRYGKPVGLTFNEVKKINVYLQIEDFGLFKKFRMREKQHNLMNFI